MIRLASNHLLTSYDKGNYNSAGPFMFRRVIEKYDGKDKQFNAPSHYFYPASESYKVQSIFHGDLQLNDQSYALHWFGGHPMSQKFNAIYTEEFAQKSQDTMSRFLRGNNII
jgi:hypothetical protein